MIKNNIKIKQISDFGQTGKRVIFLTTDLADTEFNIFELITV